MRKILEHKRCTTLPKGLTLVELLVVMGILSVLAAIALPNIKTMIKQQRLGRSAAAVQVYIDAARAKAIGDGHSYGVVIERAGSDNPIDRAQSFLLRHAYAPPPYSGDTPEAVAVVLPSGNLAFSPMHAPTLVAAARQNKTGNVNAIVQPGDIVEIGTVGVSLPIQSIRFAVASDFVIPGYMQDLQRTPGFVPANGNTTDKWPIDGNPTQAQIDQWPVIVLGNAVWNDGVFDAAERVIRVLNPGSTVPFFINRRPRASIMPPLEMVEGTVVDLTYSGMGIGSPSFSPAAISGDFSAQSLAFAAGNIPYGAVTIMFDAQGAVSEVRIGSTIVPSTSNIFLLVGRTGNVRPGDSVDGITGVNGPVGIDRAGRANILDNEAVWIVINRQTGEVYTSTIDALPLNPNGTPNLVGATPFAQLQYAITYSQQSAASFYTGGN